MAKPGQPLTLPVVEYAPDMPALNDKTTVTVSNVIPITPMSYGPMPSFSGYGGALNKQCQGTAAFQDSSGNVTIFAGDANDLYSYTSGSPTPSIVSKSSGVYNTPTDGQWNFTQFGSRVLATNYSDPIQTFTLGTSSAFADLNSAAPKAKYGDVIKSFYVVADTNDATNGAQPQRVWWSANNDPTNWPTPGTSSAAEFQSSFNDLVGDGGWNQGIVGNLGTADGAVFQERAVWRVIYEGPPNTFGFYPAEGVRGTPAPNSIVHYSNTVYYLGEDDFYRFDGTQSSPLGVNRVAKTFFANANEAFPQNIIGAADPVNRCIIWAYPSRNNSTGIPDSVIVYNWAIDRWAVGAASTEWIARVFTFGYNLDTLDTTGYNLDTLPYSLDSRVWTGGVTVLGGFDTNHKLGYFNGQPLAATVDTVEIQPIPGFRSLVNNSIPLVDGGSPSVAIGTRLRQVDPVSFSAPVSLNSYGGCPQRVEGRYLRSRITTQAGDTAWNHIEGVQLELVPGGRF